MKRSDTSYFRIDAANGGGFKGSADAIVKCTKCGREWPDVFINSDILECTCPAGCGGKCVIVSVELKPKENPP